MRRSLITGILFVVVAVIAAGCTYTQVAHSPPEVEYVEPEPYYYDGAFAELSHWGEWIPTGPFGWVWRPYVDAHWQPYYHGNWAWTQWGWTWVSYEPFGWAAYHYGFWHYDAIYGWIWIPGDQWFSARVSWMYYDDLVFWAPIPPPGYYIPDPWDVHVDFIWVGVRTNHFLRSEIGRYRLKDPRQVWHRVPRAKVRREAPQTEYIERRTRSKIRPIDVGVKNVKKNNREYKRMILPPAEKQAADRYEKRREESIKSRSNKSKQKTGSQSKSQSQGTKKSGTSNKGSKTKKKQ